MDSTGASYGDLSRRTDSALSVPHLQKLVTRPISEFPKPRTVQLLSDLLQVPVTTIVLAFASSLGLPVRQAGTALEVTLPPGTDALTAEDREAIRKVTAALVQARTQMAPGSGKSESESVMSAAQDDFGLAARRGQSEGRRLRDRQDHDAEA